MLKSLSLRYQMTLAHKNPIMLWHWASVCNPIHGTQEGGMSSAKANPRHDDEDALRREMLSCTVPITTQNTMYGPRLSCS